MEPDEISRITQVVIVGTDFDRVYQDHFTASFAGWAWRERVLLDITYEAYISGMLKLPAEYLFGKTK